MGATLMDTGAGGAMAEEQARLVAMARGRVQMVGYRDFVRRQAVSLRLRGYVLNLPSGEEVLVEAEGSRAALEELLLQLQRGPPLAAVQNVGVTWAQAAGQFPDFRVR